MRILEKVKSHQDFSSFEKSFSARKPFGLDGVFSNSKDFKSSKDGLIDPLVCYGKGKKIGYKDKNCFTFKS